jgi:hypothetical protein
MRVVRGHLLRLLGRMSPHQYYRMISGFDGAFFMRRRYWIDCNFLRSLLPQEVMIELEKYSIPFSEMGERFTKKLTPREKLAVMQLMLTLEEASIFTRIPVKAWERAIILLQIKSVSLGGKIFIPRTELEKILGCIIDSESIERVCEKALSRETRRKYASRSP